MNTKKKKNLSNNRWARALVFPAAMLMTIIIVWIGFSCQGKIEESKRVLKKIGVTRGICVLLGDIDCKLAIGLAQESELLIYVQLANTEDVETARQAVDEAGFYGSRIFVEKGELTRVHLADNLADAIITVGEGTNISESEALRVIRPGGKAITGRKELIKQFPEGTDDWSHPYHGPDNNPQSEDKIARAPYLTQFLAEPYYAPLTQVAVASAGRVFKAFGNIAFHVREEALLNSLVAYDGYNGTMLWKRKLNPGVMIHRNTMIATPGILYVGDDKSCKVIDAVTGKLKKEIIPPKNIAGGTFWKWMALENGVIYALIGEQEQKDPVVRQRREAHGWPWDPLSKGFNQPENPWGFGRNLLAINPKTKKVLWSHRETEKIDSRALCMKNGRIYIYRHGAFLACLDAKSGEDIWRKTPDNSPELFEALGEYLYRQDWRTNWRTTTYTKCSDKALYFAGPTIGKLLAVSAKDGSILWEDPYNNFQLVLRDDGLYGISGQIDEHPSKKFDPLTGKVLAELDTKRRACTRPNGSVDAILYRAEGGSVRLDIASQYPQWISPMRAQCHDGVTIANGLLYWWPSICDCQNTLYGITCLGPAGDFNFSQKATEEERLEQYDLTNVASLDESPADWPAFRANNYCNATTEAVISKDINRLWWFTPGEEFIPTAPVTVGGIVFFSGSDGIVRALDISTGEIRWKGYTGGPVRFPPAVWEGRVLVGSGDGWVYAFEAQTGRLLWRFNAAPEQRKIPVYGSLMSTWPVASGVVIEDGIAYFAAGIVNYDGIHVYALDAATGKIKWQNNTSGHLDAEARTGASVQGHMLIYEGKLYLASGTSFSPAVYDIRDGKCLNDPASLRLCASNCSRGWELSLVGDKVVAFGMPLYGHPEYPVYDPTVTNKILHSAVGDRDIVWLNNRTVMCFNPVERELLNNCVADPDKKSFFMNVGWGKFDIPDKPLWEYNEESIAIALCKNAVVMAVKSPDGTMGVGALDLQDGNLWWKHVLPCSPVPWGLAVDSNGRIIVTLKDGEVICFGTRD
jgi:outer membrane protein assembly factor BamB